MKPEQSDISLRRSLSSSLRTAGLAAWTKPARLLLVAAIFHVTLVVVIYLIGRAELVPGVFDTNGFGAFAPDNYSYQKQASSLAEILTQGGISAWLVEPTGVHIKLFSLSFAIFGPLFGFTTLAAEPLNLLYYLAILTLVFELGREVFDRRAGFLAASIVALWPSFLLTTTQLQKDPLFVVSMLALVLCIAELLTREYSWRGSLATGFAAAAAGTLVWLVRTSMDELVLLITIFGAGLLAIRMLRERRLLAANLAGVALLLALTLSSQAIPQVVNLSQGVLGNPAEQGTSESPPTLGAPVSGGAPALTIFSDSPGTSSPDDPEGGLPDDPEMDISYAQPPFWTETPQLPTLVERLAAMISLNRLGFALDTNGGSNIDTDVQPHSTPDLVRYLPRAMEIGFLAPFPNTWLTAGVEVSLSAKLVSVPETLAIYALEFFALLGLWWQRCRLSTWFLLLVAMAGVTLLSTVMTNVGTLYRQRYAFFILVVVLGAIGMVRLLSALSARKNKEKTES